MESETTALLLQQVRDVRQERTVLFGLVCEARKKGVAGSFCEKTVDFFREHFRERDFCQRFEQYKNACLKGEEGVSYAGALCVNGDFVLFADGNVHIYTVSGFLMRPRVKRILPDGTTDAWGRMEKGVSLLIATEGMWAHSGEELIGKGLFMPEYRGESRLERHLEELCRRTVEKGGKDMACIVLRA